MTPIERFRRYVNKLDGPVAIIHDTDPDGMSAGVLAKKGLESLGIEVATTIPKEHGPRAVTDTLLTSIGDAQNIICVDLALESYDGADRLRDRHVLVIDHHPTTEPHEESFLVIKPHDIQDDVKDYQYCAAHLVHHLFNEVTDMSPWNWIALAGNIGDMTYPHHKEVEEWLKEYNQPILEDIYETPFAELVKYIGYGSAMGDNEQIIFDALDTAKDWQDAIEKMHAFNVVRDEQQRLLDAFPEKAERYGHIYFYEIETDYHLGSAVSTILSKKKVGASDILVVLQDKDKNMTSASARRQDCQQHMGEMMQYATKNLVESNGGGHIPAAGAKFQTEDKEDFKQNIIDWAVGVPLTNEELLAKIEEFAANVGERPVIMSDTDPDGLAAAAILMERFAEKNPQLILHGHIQTNVPEDEIKIINSGTDLIVADLPLETYNNRHLIEVERILVIDHHGVTEDDQMLLAKPALLQNAVSNDEICSASLCYKLFGGKRWLASIGVHGDLRTKVEPGFADRAVEELVELLNYTYSVHTKESAKQGFEALLHSETPQEAERMLEEYAQHSTEIERLQRQFESEKQEHDNLIFFGFEAKLKASKILGHHFALLHPDKTLIIYQTLGDEIKISARRKDGNEDVAILLQQATKEIPGSSAGGHLDSAGATFPAAHLQTVKENIMRIHNG